MQTRPAVLPTATRQVISRPDYFERSVPAPDKKSVPDRMMTRFNCNSWLRCDSRSLAGLVIFRQRISGMIGRVSEWLLGPRYQVPEQTARVRRHGSDRFESAPCRRAT